MFERVTDVTEIGGPGNPIENPAWTFGDFLLITLAFVAFLLIAVLLSVFAAVGLHRSGDAESILVLGVVAQTLAYAATMVVIRRAISHRTSALHRYLTLFAAIRWNAPKRRPEFIALGIALGLVFSSISRFLPIRTDLPIEQAIRGLLSAYVTMLFGVLIAPLFEEVYFRGLMYPVLVRSFRSAGATLAVSASVITTSAAFALVHGAQLGFSWAPLLVIFLVGLALTLVRAHTRSLAASWLVHVSYNTTLFGFMLVQTRGFHRLS
ncbi:MAG: hypothetical protein NVS9B15_12390 [Acidobacteriaceae bacterium]